MEVQNISSSSTMSCNKDEGEDDDVPLPGFRFHPTEEELVGFYLKRKVEKRPLSIELIKQADIYKYDPWDLPKTSNVGEKEWFFFCQRGRKYRNSIRPNRVTGSGFWKATGIDRPVYESSSGCIIGLKKSLVYYRGSAGKGTKTDWMMHEFRLPAPHDKSAKHFDSKALVAQEAEVWTLCRIFKKSVTYKKSVSDWRSESTSKRASAADYSTTSKTCSSNNNSNNSSSITSSDHNKAGMRQNLGCSYISFGKNAAPSSSMSPPHQLIINTATAQMVHDYCTKLYSQPQILANFHNHNNTPAAHSMTLQSLSISSQPQASFAADAAAATPAASSVTGSVCEFLRHGADWEDLRSVVLDSAATVLSGNYNPLYS